MGDHRSNTPPVALVVGVTGMAGLSIAEYLKSPAAPGGPWIVYGSARREKPSWFPPSAVDRYITFDAANSDDTLHKLYPLAAQITHVFWAALQVCATEEENCAVNSAMLANVLNVLTKSESSKLRHVTVQTGSKHYIGPIFDPFISTQLSLPDPPFLEDAPRVPFPNFYYELEDLVTSYTPKITHSIHRCSIIFGASTRSTYNFLLTFSVYAEICKYERAPFRYPGNQYTWEHLCDLTDARVLAEQQAWAATTEGARNETFNCTNGDVFTWKRMWKLLSEVFEVEYVPFDEGDGKFDWVSVMRGKGHVWDRIVEEKGLFGSKMEEITCYAAVNTVLNIGFELVSSMNKSKDFGFIGYADTPTSTKYWVMRLRELNIIP